MAWILLVVAIVLAAVAFVLNNLQMVAPLCGLMFVVAAACFLAALWMFIKGWVHKDDGQDPLDVKFH